MNYCRVISNISFPIYCGKVTQWRHFINRRWSDSTTYGLRTRAIWIM